jgi:hypothetical protein
MQTPPGKNRERRVFEAWAQRIYHIRVNHDTHVGEANVLLNWMGSQTPLPAEFPKVLGSNRHLAGGPRVSDLNATMEA